MLYEDVQGVLLSLTMVNVSIYNVTYYCYYTLLLKMAKTVVIYKWYHIKSWEK